MESYYSLLLFIAITLLLSALFSGVEIAFISSDKLVVELQRKKGSFSAGILSKFYQNSSHFIGTMLIGNTLSLVLYTIYMTEVMDKLNFTYEIINSDSEFVLLLIQTLISTIIVLFISEFTPKSIFLINPNRMLSFFAIPMAIVYYLLYPIVSVVMVISKFLISKIMRVDYPEGKPVFGRTDLNNYIKNRLESEEETDKQLLSEVDTKIFSNALEFKQTKVRDCMTPRTEIVAIEVDADIEQLRKAFIDSGHSKVIVYRESVDEVIGYCHSTSLFKYPKKISEISKPIIFATETMLANDLLLKFIAERKSLALVLDEFGGTSGLISIEDVMEEIFGEIEDEYDSEKLVETKIDDHNYLLSARHEVDELNEKYTWNLPVGDYDTLGGLILEITGSLPKINDVIELEDSKITIITMHNNKIDTVKLEFPSGQNE